MQKRTRRVGAALAIAAAALALAACNPATFTATSGTIPGYAQPAAHTPFYRYDGAAPAWIQVRVTSSVSNRIEVRGSSDDPSSYCIGDGPFGTDLWVPCPAINDYGVTSATRAVWTEGVGRGWKKLFAVNPGTEVHVTFTTNGPLGEKFPIEVAAVDGNGAVVGDLTKIQVGVGQ